MTPARRVSSFFLWCFVVELSHGMTDADLTPRALSTVSASVNCTGSLLTLAQPRAPSKVAKFWGWEYEARLQGSCRRLFKDKNEEAAWPPPRWSRRRAPSTSELARAAAESHALAIWRVNGAAQPAGRGDGGCERPARRRGAARMWTRSRRASVYRVCASLVR